MNKPFWEQPLESLSDDEWEALCDGCGQCCLVKLQDDDTNEILATDVVCRFHDLPSGKCGVYSERALKKPDCFVIERDNIEHYSWLPQTCAYRLRFEGNKLPDWHPLISKSRKKMIATGVAIEKWAVNELGVDDNQLQARVIFSLQGDE